jgi:hypothetical protein
MAGIRPCPAALALGRIMVYLWRQGI